MENENENEIKNEEVYKGKNILLKINLFLSIIHFTFART